MHRVVRTQRFTTFPFHLSSAFISQDTEALPTLAGEAPYPDPSSFPHSEVDKLLEMPNGKRITLEWLREEIWGEAEEFEIPAEDVTQGKQVRKSQYHFATELC